MLLKRITARHFMILCDMTSNVGVMHLLACGDHRHSYVIKTRHITTYICVHVVQPEVQEGRGKHGVVGRPSSEGEEGEGEGGTWEAFRRNTIQIDSPAKAGAFSCEYTERYSTLHCSTAHPIRCKCISELQSEMRSYRSEKVLTFSFRHHICVGWCSLIFFVPLLL